MYTGPNLGGLTHARQALYQERDSLTFLKTPSEPPVLPCLPLHKAVLGWFPLLLLCEESKEELILQSGDVTHKNMSTACANPWVCFLHRDFGVRHAVHCPWGRRKWSQPFVLDCSPTAADTRSTVPSHGPLLTQRPAAPLRKRKGHTWPFASFPMTIFFKNVQDFCGPVEQFLMLGAQLNFKRRLLRLLESKMNEQRQGLKLSSL